VLDVINITSNHPYEHKIAAFTYYINRLVTLTITNEAKLNEWETILAIAKLNGYPTNMIHNLKTKLINKKQNQKQQER
jgi:hypothetical protein